VPFDPAQARESRIILLYGDEEGLRTRAYQELMAGFQVQDGDMDVESLLANERSPVEWIGAAATYPFLAEFRVVVVRNVTRVSPTDLWEGAPIKKDHPAVALLQQVPETGRLILVADDELGEKLAARAKTVASQWAKLVAFAGGAAHEFTADKKGPIDAFRQYAIKVGKPMTPSAATALSEMLSGRLSLGLGEIEKLAIYVGDEPEIRDEHVRALVNPEPEYRVFTMIDAIVEGKSGAALQELKTMIGHKPKVNEEAFSRIFPVVGRQLRLLWQARSCFEAGCSPAKPTPEVAATFLDKPKISAEAEWLQSKLMRTAKRLNFAQLAACLNLLLEADAKLKGALPAANDVETLESMVVRMVDVCRQSSPALVRR